MSTADDQLARASRISGPIQTALSKNLLNDSSPVCDFIDLQGLRNRFNELQTALPEWNNAVAIKSNPICGVLLEAKSSGLGAEVASMGEIQHALNIGFSPEKIVYYSPVKTMDDLEFAIKGDTPFHDEVWTNHASLLMIVAFSTVSDWSIRYCEMGRVSLTLLRTIYFITTTKVNPNVGAGKIAMSSTAGRSSKFGLLMVDEFEAKVLELFKQNSWLQGLHQHIGSQGMLLDQLVLGAERLVNLAEKINVQAGHKQIQFIDVGGGISTDYHSDNEKISFGEYAELISERVPKINDYHVISEFGRSLFVKYGFSISKVEAVKNWGDTITALTHFGGNRFLWEVYMPQVWFHRISVFDKNGNPKRGELMEHDIGGPLCFQGDYIAKGRLLPMIETGDYLVMHDTGGYTYALYSRFNSIQAPSVYGYEANPKGEVTFYELKSRETVEETINFWGHTHPLAV